MVPAQSITISSAGATAMKYIKLILPLMSLAGTLILAQRMVMP